MIYIIDGYNVLHTREPDGITRDQLEDKRQSLVEEVISYIAAAGDEAIIVFDSTVAESPECHPVPNTAVTVCYSSKSMIADILIGKLVQQKLAATRDGIKVVAPTGRCRKRLDETGRARYAKAFSGGNKNFKRLYYLPKRIKCAGSLNIK